MGYNAETKQFSYRSAHGVMSTSHPSTSSTEQPIPAYASDGSIVAPLQPPDDSGYVLAPEANGGWCYVNPANGKAQWHAPPGSGPLQTRTLVTVSEPFSTSPPWLDRSFRVMSPVLQRVGRWKPIFHDRQQCILLLNLDTGALREAPWVSLRTDDGLLFFANLFTRETRWFPPHLWMDGWIARCVYVPQRRGPGHFACPALDARSPLLRDMLDIDAGRLCVEGGAPYMHEHGLPQYQPDESDTLDTHPGLLRPQL